MKRLLSLLMALSLTLFIRCGSDDKGIDNPDEPVNPEDVTLEISTTDLLFEAQGGEKEFTITCNTGWTITNESAWCTTDATSGNGNRTVTVSVSASSETADRNTNLTVKAGGKTQIVTVTQKHANALILSKNKFDVPQEGGDITIEIKAGIEYQTDIPEQCRSWIHQTSTRAAESQSINFTIEANEGSKKRTGYIFFSGNAQKDTVFIYQAPKNILILSEDTYTVPTEGAKITVELKTNIDYEVKIPDDAASWVSLITTRALRTDRLTFRIEANTGDADRSAKIAVKDKNSDFSNTITILQPIERGDIIWETEQDLIDFKAAGHTRIQGNIIVRGKELKTLQKLDNLLTEIDGSLTLECPSLTSLDGLYNLAKITGDLRITGGAMISFKGLSNLKSIGGDFAIYAETPGLLTDLESFEGLENLQTIGGDFWMTTNSLLASFKGLDNLKSIGGDFEVIVWYSIKELKSFEGLENLESIGGNFIVRDNENYFLNSLASFKGLSSLKSIGGNFEINAYNSLRALESFEGLENLQTIGGNFKVTASYYSLTSLASFKGLSSLKSIGGDFEINAYNSLSALESFEGLENLQTIGGNFIVSTNDYFYVTGNASLTSLASFKGLSNLKSIGGDFEVKPEASFYEYTSSFDSYPLQALESFEGLENLQVIGGNFKVTTFSDHSPDSYSSLTSLASFKGLGSLKSIGGDFEINAEHDNSLSALESFEGLENLQAIGGNFKIISPSSYSLNSLASFKGLSSLKSIGGNFEINAYNSLSALESFEGLENLQAIGGNFKITSPSSYSLNSLASFKGLNSLKNIGGKNLVIDGCSALSSIDDLKNVEALDEISIIDCPKLYDFCVLKNAVQNMSGPFTAILNGYNPTKEQLQNGACSQTPPDDNNDN